ncbi:hypothetical protein M378DRAFT_22431, partial [Amanita muscaria Koide BX008]
MSMPVRNALAGNGTDLTYQHDINRCAMSSFPHAHQRFRPTALTTPGFVSIERSKENAMRAVLIKDGLGPADNLYIGEAPTPTPKPGEVLIKINAFGLNRMDILQREGRYPPPPGSSSLLGVEFSGIIVDLGPSVSGWKVDDEVLGLTGGGAYAEYIVC